MSPDISARRGLPPHHHYDGPRGGGARKTLQAIIRRQPVRRSKTTIGVAWVCVFPASLALHTRRVTNSRSENGSTTALPSPLPPPPADSDSPRVAHGCRDAREWGIGGPSRQFQFSFNLLHGKLMRALPGLRGLRSSAPIAFVIVRDRNRHRAIGKREKGGWTGRTGWSGALEGSVFAFVPSERGTVHRARAQAEKPRSGSGSGCSWYCTTTGSRRRRADARGVLCNACLPVDQPAWLASTFTTRKTAQRSRPGL